MIGMPRITKAVRRQRIDFEALTPGGNDREVVAGRDRGFRPEPVQGEPLHQRVTGLSLAIDQ